MGLMFRKKNAEVEEFEDEEMDIFDDEEIEEFEEITGTITVVR